MLVLVLVLGINVGVSVSVIGPLQVSIDVVQNRHIGTQTSHWDKTNNGNYHLELCVPFVGLTPIRLLLPICRFCTTWMETFKGLIVSVVVTIGWCNCQCCC